FKRLPILPSLYCFRPWVADHGFRKSLLAFSPRLGILLAFIRQVAERPGYEERPFGRSSHDRFRVAILSFSAFFASGSTPQFEQANRKEEREGGTDRPPKPDRNRA